MATSIGTASLASQTTLLQSTEDRMLHQLRSQPASREDAKIEKGAKDFEAMLLTTWMQQAEKSIATVPGAEDDEDAAGREQMMSLGVQSVATSLAANGGIGIARMIAKAMHSVAEKADARALNPDANPENVQTGKKP
jgi:Rod binding domain-containing protein